MKKKHFFIILKGFQLSKIVSDHRVRLKSNTVIIIQKHQEIYSSIIEMSQF